MDPFDAHRTALLVMDFQVEILRGPTLGPSDEADRDRLDHAVDRAAHALAWARGSGARVFHVRHAFAEGYPDLNEKVPLTRFMASKGALLLGEPGTAFDARVAPREDEAIITKQTISPLTNTPLPRILEDLGIDTLLLSGVATHFVVEGTARQAADMGYRTVVLTDACASGDLERHVMSLRNLGMLTELTKTDVLVLPD